jgi:hypothetical protein
MIEERIEIAVTEAFIDELPQAGIPARQARRLAIQWSTSHAVDALDGHQLFQPAQEIRFDCSRLTLIVRRLGWRA